jgi:hypothetical protein
MSSSPFLARKSATQLIVRSGCFLHLVPDLFRQIALDRVKRGSDSTREVGSRKETIQKN